MVDKTPQAVLTANEVTAIIERTILFGMDTLAGPEEDVAFDVSVLRGIGLISTKAGTTYSLAQADRLTLNDFTNAAGCVITLQNETNETAWPVGTAAYIRVAAGAGSITFAADSGVTIASPGASLAAGPAGSIVKVLKSASNEYTLSGHLKFGVVVATLAENTAPDGTEDLFTSADERIGLDTIAKFTRALTPNAQTGTTYTLVLGDANQPVTMNNASANTLTIPLNSSVAFPVGTIITVSQLGAGVTTVDGATGVTVNGVSGGGAAIDAQYGGVSIMKIATDTWLMQGAHGTVA